MTKKLTERQVHRLLIDIDGKTDPEDEKNTARNIETHIKEIQAYQSKLRRRGENQLADYYDGLVQQKTGKKRGRAAAGPLAAYKTFKPSLKPAFSFTAPSMHGAFQILGYILVIGGLTGVLYLGYKIHTQVNSNIDLEKKLDQYEEYYEKSR